MALFDGSPERKQSKTFRDGISRTEVVFLRRSKNGGHCIITISRGCREGCVCVCSGSNLERPVSSSCQLLHAAYHGEGIAIAV